MLILNRPQPGDSIRIGDEIEVVVLEVEKGHVKLGFKAPKEVPIDREELFEGKSRNGPTTGGT